MWVKQTIKQKQCPVCYSYIEIEECSGYGIMCEEVIYEIHEGIESDLLKWINEK